MSKYEKISLKLDGDFSKVYEICKTSFFLKLSLWNCKISIFGLRRSTRECIQIIGTNNCGFCCSQRIYRKLFSRSNISQFLFFAYIPDQFFLFSGPRLLSFNKWLIFCKSGQFFIVKTLMWHNYCSQNFSDCSKTDARGQVRARNSSSLRYFLSWQKINYS